MKHILIAPNAMKGSLTAFEFAKAIAEGLHTSDAKLRLDLCPVADGGDGTFSILGERLKCETKFLPVLDPLKREVKACFGWNEQTKTALVEMAETSGIHLLKEKELNPLVASTHGLGQLLKTLIEGYGAKHIYLGVGGTATVDCGFGMLDALGVRFFDKHEQIIESYSEIQRAEHVEASAFQSLFADTKVTILSDVRNPLLGIMGAAEVFGPQKGACMWKVKILEGRNQKMVELLDAEQKLNVHTQEGSGAAGGVAYPLLCLLPHNVEIVSGVHFVFEQLGVEQKVRDCDVVITGEGGIDRQSFSGKALGELVALAKKYHKPIVGLCGVFDESVNNYPLDGLYSINPKGMDFHEQMKQAYQNCVTFASQLANDIQKLA